MLTWWQSVVSFEVVYQLFLYDALFKFAAYTSKTYWSVIIILFLFCGCYTFPGSVVVMGNGFVKVFSALLQVQLAWFFSLVYIL